jgi:DNA-binding LytR/AlgR family response regulator
MKTVSLIIEDEKPAARRLQRMLAKEGFNRTVMLHSVQKAIEWLNNNPPPDIIFADIRLPDGLSFEIFEQTKISSPVIFTTAYDHYAVKAFKINSIDYLLKPVKQEELHFALQQFKKQNHLQLHHLQNLYQQLQNQKNYKIRFSAQYGSHLQSIPADDICYFYTSEKTTYIVTHTGEEFIYEASLETIENNINPNDFFRVNRQYIIRFGSFDDIIAYSNSRLKLLIKKPKHLEIIVARERVKKFKNWLEQ